jgi:hypothetical protein
MNAIALHEEPSNERSLEQLEDEIATLSATIQAATYRLLCLVEEYDRRGGWADPLDSNGFRSLAHWLSWRVGLSLTTARQQVAVARKLPEMPRVAAAFEAGQLSYSKVRALSRVVTPENEEEFLFLARSGTASHLERIVREYRRSRGAAETEQAREQQTSRCLTTYWDRDGMLVVRGRLPPEEGALLLKALNTSKDDLLRLTETPSTENASAETPSAENASAETPSAGTTRDCTTGPQLMADALARVAEQALAHRTGGDRAADRFQVVVHVDAEVLADPEADGRCALEDGPHIAPETVRRLACDCTLRGLAHAVFPAGVGSHGELEAGRKTRVVGAALRRALVARDGTRCAFPGCNCRARDAHHIKHWADGGATVLSNVLGLCRAHHVFVHELGYRVELAAGGGFRFRRPDGREVLASPPLPTVTGDAAQVLARQWLPPGVHITPSTGRTTWQGERVDYDMALEALWMCDGADSSIGSPRS